MMAKPILQRKNAIEYKQISIKVPVKLHERVLAFRDRLEKIDPELMFNVSAVCQGALEAALKQAEKELDDIEQATKQSGENPTCNGLQSKHAGPAIKAIFGPHYLQLTGARTRIICN